MPVTNLYDILAAAMFLSIPLRAVDEQQSGKGRSALAEVAILAAAKDRRGHGVRDNTLQMPPFQFRESILRKPIPHKSH